MAVELLRTEIAGFARDLAASFTMGTPLVDALDSMAESAGSLGLQNAIKKIRSDVMQGIQLNYTMEQTGVFPDGVINQVAIGEKEGALDVTFSEVAKHYEQMDDDS
jgi:type IV pilus assembly protein PilC